MFRTIFHTIAVTVNVITLWYDQKYIDLPMPVKAMESYPLRSRSMFLTFWCLKLQTLYHFIALLNDLFGTNARTPKKTPTIRRIRDTLFSLAFTVAVYVSSAFWGIYAVDKDLIYPDHIAKLYHPSINHVMHTTVSIFIIIELLSSYITYPSRKTGVTVMMAFYLSYLTWFFSIYANTGAWVYPVFNPLSWPLRIVFIIMSLILAMVFYLAGEKLNNLICSNGKSYANGIKNGIDKSKKRT